MAEATNLALGTVTLTGDLDGTALVPTLRATGVSPGEYIYPDVVVNGKGLIVDVSSPFSNSTYNSKGILIVDDNTGLRIISGVLSGADSSTSSRGVLVISPNTGLTITDGVLDGTLSSGTSTFGMIKSGNLSNLTITNGIINIGPDIPKVDTFSAFSASQVEDSSSTFTYWYVKGQRGYFGGGTTGSDSSEIDGIRFDTEAAINPSSTLAAARFTLSGVNSSTRGYYGGGVDQLNSRDFFVDGISFGTEAAFVLSSKLSEMEGAGSFSSSTSGYFGGGSRSGVTFSDDIDALRFNTETTSLLSAVLPTGHHSLAGVNSSTKGYWGGGYKSGIFYSDYIDGLEFSNETSFNISAVLNVARARLASVNSHIRGYWGGGYKSGAVLSNDIDGIRFDTEAAINPSSTLSVARSSHAGVNSVDKGYFGGGYTTVNSSEIDGIQFSDETAINPSATLSVARWGLAGTSIKNIVESETTDTNAEGIYANLTVNQNYVHTLTMDRVILTSGINGANFTIILIQDSVGGHTVTFDDYFKFNTAPVINTTANGVTMIEGFVTDNFILARQIY